MGAIVLIEKIYAQARQAPDKAAIVLNNNPMSYRVFARGIDAARRYLAAQELPGSGVAVLAINGLLGVWTLGFALRSLGLTTVAVPVPERVGRLGLPDVKCVITTEAEHSPRLVGACADAGWRLITVPTAIYADRAAGDAPAVPDLPAAEGGHILLSSGTTGIHKKILMSPFSQAHFCTFHQSIYGISDQSVVNVLSFGGWVGVSYKSSVATWDAGGTVVTHQGPNIHEVFRHRGITHTYTMPRMLAAILSAPANALRRNDAMQLVVTAGSLPQAVAEAAKVRLTQRVYTHYATTEGGVHTLTPIERLEDLRWHRILPSCELHVVDDEGRVLPPGREGLVRVRPTPGVTGYLYDAEASRRFFRDGYFYPGDLGMIGPDGGLALHGRATDVVNVLGNKIAAGPIEEALQNKFGVSGACVFSMPRADGEEIVHVVIESSQRIDGAALGAGLRNMFPASFRAQVHYVDALPRNHMDKIQRDVLKQRLGFR